MAVPKIDLTPVDNYKTTRVGKGEDLGNNDQYDQYDQVPWNRQVNMEENLDLRVLERSD